MKVLTKYINQMTQMDLDLKSDVYYEKDTLIDLINYQIKASQKNPIAIAHIAIGALSIVIENWPLGEYREMLRWIPKWCIKKEELSDIFRITTALHKFFLEYYKGYSHKDTCYKTVEDMKLMLKTVARDILAYLKTGERRISVNFSTGRIRGH